MPKKSPLGKSCSMVTTFCEIRSLTDKDDLLLQFEKKGFATRQEYRTCPCGVNRKTRVAYEKKHAKDKNGLVEIWHAEFCTQCVREERLQFYEEFLRSYDDKVSRMIHIRNRALERERSAEKRCELYKKQIDRMARRIYEFEDRARDLRAKNKAKHDRTRLHACGGVYNRFYELTRIATKETVPLVQQAFAACGGIMHEEQERECPSCGTTRMEKVQHRFWGNYFALDDATIETSWFRYCEACRLELRAEELGEKIARKEGQIRLAKAAERKHTESYYSACSRLETLEKMRSKTTERVVKLRRELAARRAKLEQHTITNS